ncbi:hypothetical protein, partial [Desulfovibrio sp.]|uniref:hypothetical protein n=1 Tax=Desulfovibrio sp. TaxID=885 RepID=UPI003FEF5014
QALTGPEQTTRFAGGSDCSPASEEKGKDAWLRHRKRGGKNFFKPVACSAEGTDFACHLRKISFE